MKHDPALLVQLSQHFVDRPDVRVVVITEGIGRRWLEQQKAQLGLANLILMDFQPFAEVPQALAAADVLTAILEPSAGVFSVPSKVLAYLCASRALLLAVPPENLASKTVERIHAGLVSHPTAVEGFLSHADQLYEDAALRATLGTNGRTYAEATFNIDSIAAEFIGVFDGLAASRMEAPNRKG
jgi:glycosyltransferase involved in cell wall biosynthesis